MLVLGRVEPHDWLKRADIFVHTSRWEGFGIVLLEAMLSSLPVVATRVSAVPEIVLDGETGLLAPPGDSNALAGHLATLLDDPERRRALGANGLRRAREQFSVDRMTERTLSRVRALTLMKEVSLRELARGTPAPDRVALLSIWFHGHNNPRYAELLPRLDRLDACLLRLPDARIPRGLGFRAFTATKPLLLRAALGRASQRYSSLLSLDFAQLDRWRGAAVMDADDPFFTEREVALLGSPSVRAYVVTAESAARRYETLGVAKPWVVIPQGVNLEAATAGAAAAGGGAEAAW